jgi:hypothetical protein
MSLDNIKNMYAVTSASTTFNSTQNSIFVLALSSFSSSQSAQDQTHITQYISVTYTDLIHQIPSLPHEHRTPHARSETDVFKVANLSRPDWPSASRPHTSALQGSALSTRLPGGFRRDRTSHAKHINSATAANTLLLTFLLDLYLYFPPTDYF